MAVSTGMRNQDVTIPIQSRQYLTRSQVRNQLMKNQVMKNQPMKNQPTKIFQWEFPHLMVLIQHLLNHQLHQVC